MADLEYRHPRFHWQDGWFFVRLTNGSVLILKKEKATDEAKVTVKTIIPPDEWASIIAFVSGGEDKGENYEDAKKFHKGR